MKKILNVFLLIMLVFICGSCNINNLPKEEIDLEKAYNEYFIHKKSEFSELLGKGNVRVKYIKREDASSEEFRPFSSKNIKDLIYLEYNEANYRRRVYLIMSTYNPYNSLKDSLFCIYKNCMFDDNAIVWEYLLGISDENGVKTSLDKKVLLRVNDSDNYNIPNEVNSLASYSFSCINIETLYCNSNLKKISTNAFFNNISLKYVYINPGIMYIGSYAFDQCINLEYVVLPDGNYVIENKVFNYGNIFCESYTKQPNWDDNFATNEAKVYYKGEWAYGEDGKPYVLGK